MVQEAPGQPRSPQAWDGKGAPMFDCAGEDWRKALTSGSIEKYQPFLRERGLSPNDNPLEASASEHGFTPENAGNAAMDLSSTHCTHDL